MYNIYAVFPQYLPGNKLTKIAACATKDFQASASGVGFA